MLALVFLSDGADPQLVSGMVQRGDELAKMVAS
jgi:hypothetical protein